jgi:tetratricopeptide (TPR) repeat protein
LPDNKDEALLMMYMAGTTLDSTGYANMVDEFIARFPDAEDGYINRAQLAYNGRDFATAARYMQQAISMSNPKDNAHFAYSRLIYTYCLQHADSQFADWTLDKAAEEAKTAYDISQQAAYKHQLAQILFAQKKYDDALALFNELATSDMRGAEVYYETARCYEMKGDTTKMMALLDSAVNVFTKPYLKEAAPYIWARAMARMNAGKHRLAVQDMNEYEQLIATGLNAQFYFIREQAEVAGKQFQQALDDITKATQLAPEDPDYFAEKASLETRVGLYDEAAASARECIRLAPQGSDGYLLLGVALCQKGDKKNGLPQIQKAKELGNGQADSLLERYK